MQPHGKNASIHCHCNGDETSSATSFAVKVEVPVPGWLEMIKSENGLIRDRVLLVCLDVVFVKVNNERKEEITKHR